MENLQERYFQWICCIALSKDSIHYQSLLRYLYNKPYRYTHPRDANREADGIELRYRFAYSMGVAPAEVACELDDKPCSMLEMMIALAIRCEENFMRNFEIGDRTYEWFQDMIYSLQIAQNDFVFNERYVDQAVERFLNRDYAPDGLGSLFHLKHPYGDMRQVEIWDQAMWWISEQPDI